MEEEENFNEMVPDYFFSEISEFPFKNFMTETEYGEVKYFSGNYQPLHKVEERIPLPQTKYKIARYYGNWETFNVMAVDKMSIENLYGNKCTFCGAFYSADELNSKGEFTLCCDGGNVKFEFLKPCEGLLSALMDGKHRKSREFMDNIRKINSNLAFASVIINEKTLPNHSKAPPMVIVDGNVSHKIGSIYPQMSNQEKNKFIQTYFWEPGINQTKIDREYFGELTTDMVR